MVKIKKKIKKLVLPKKESKKPLVVTKEQYEKLIKKFWQDFG